MDAPAPPPRPGRFAGFVFATKQRACSTCAGDGAVFPAGDGVVEGDPCERCGGSGSEPPDPTRRARTNLIRR